MKRAYRSLWTLAALYVISLCSELLCNSDPLYVRHNGRSYFPVFRFYPENVFTGNGRQTRPDYKRIAADPAFKASPSNRMIFAPLRYGPNEIIQPASLPHTDRVTLRITAAERVGAVYLAPDSRVIRHLAAEFAFRDSAQASAPRLADHWEMPPALQEALAKRFRNEATPAFRALLASRHRPGLQAEAHLAPFTPRSAPRTTVRLTLRQRPPADAPTPSLVTVDSTGGVVRVSGGAWTRLSEAQRAALLALAVQRFDAPVDPLMLEEGDTTWRVLFEKKEVRWPYPPVRGHWLGIDHSGRDVLARLLYGLRTSMTFGLLLVVFSMGLGIALGAIQGYFGGTTDLTFQRFTEIWSALPFLYVMILLGSIYGRGFLLLLVCYGLFNWIGISHYARAEFLRLRAQPFVDAARVLGLSNRAIIFRHILPNALAPIVAFFPFQLVGAIGSLAALDYLGFGLPPPTPSWGELLQQAQQYRWAWWLILYPSLALFIVMLLGVFVGEGAREAFDPKPQVRLE